MTPLRSKRQQRLIATALNILEKLSGIKRALELPADTFAAVFYRGHWFWVDDGDWPTKRALTAVMFFFTLEGTGSTDNLPLVTIPAQ